ncbi:hypothetical protein N7532_006015 [Penicillium argentinense]|uniref:Uncharacterized protein n=1 Tax=Penicillium argentinense TaxID=1131581 RepID=A0A9W9KAD3_9EURO|nr:uncharacterized protein N7532_006015 [Penicillium argentinense]KAJ5099014.1 hypothetical protein N7532_006015 [Penicillium argentinense]
MYPGIETAGSTENEQLTPQLYQGHGNLSLDTPWNATSAFQSHTNNSPENKNDRYAHKPNPDFDRTVPDCRTKLGVANHSAADEKVTVHDDREAYECSISGIRMSRLDYLRNQARKVHSLGSSATA